MALNSYAALTANGTALTGDVSVVSIGGVDVSSNYIEAFEVRWGTRIDAPVGGSIAKGGRRVVDPIRILKAVDRTTPLLYQALVQNQGVDGQIKLFDTDPDDGTTRHFFTLSFTESRISAIDSCSPDTLDADFSGHPAYEFVEITPRTITYTHEIHSVEFTDEWSVRF